MRHRTWIEIWNNIKREYKTTENKKAISETSEKGNQTAEEKRHIPETSEILDETTEDNTHISKTCHRQGSTTEDNRKILHKEDWKERIQGQDQLCNDCGKGFKMNTTCGNMKEPSSILCYSFYLFISLSVQLNKYQYRW